MEILSILGVILIIAVIFLGGGVLGWFLKAFGFVIDHLWDGCLVSIKWFIIGGLILLSIMGFLGIM